MATPKHIKQNLSTKPAQQSPDNDGHILVKEEIAKWILSFVCSLLVYAAVALIVLYVYHPDIDTLTKTADKMFLQPGQAYPKPVESLLFRLGIMIVIPCLLGFYILFSRNKLKKIIVWGPVYFLLSILCVLFVIALIYFGFTALNPCGPGIAKYPQNARDITSLTNFDFYFDGIFIGKYFLLYLFFIVSAVTFLFLIGFKKYSWDKAKSFKMISSITGYAIIAWVIIDIMLMNIYDFPYCRENKYDFNAVYYSMTQVYAGVPMLVGGFTNSYGLYPHFLNPLFQVTGLNVFKFSLVMSMLTGLSFILNFYFLKQFVNNKVILFLGFTTMLFFSYLDFKLLTHFDSLFSLFPVRYIVPSVVAFMAAVYFNKRSAKTYFIIFFISALFILWNPEMGIVSYLSWLIVNIYADFYGPEGKANTKRILFHILIAIVSVSIVFSLYELTIYLFYGSWPDLSLLFEAILYFGKYGFGNLPMVLIHPWNLVALILLSGFLYSLIKLYKKQVTVSSSVILLLSLIGLGYFFYFQGRSQDSNFALSTGFSLMLLTILGDKLWDVAKRTNILSLKLLFVIFLFAVSFSFVEIIFNTPQLISLIYQEEDKQKNQDDDQHLLDNKTFINNATIPGQKFLLISSRETQALLFDGDKRALAFNPGWVDMFLHKDMERLEYTLRDSGFTVFVEPAKLNHFLARPIAAFAATYEFASKNESISLCNKRKRSIPTKAFFQNMEQPVIYRKYNDDTTGVAARINDALGVTANKLNPEFSIQALFYATPQVFENVAIIGSLIDSSGFIIGMIKNDKYYFQVNNAYTTYNIAYNQWIYCIVNVYSDHFIIYMNGAHDHFSVPLSSPVKNSSDNNISIGNLYSYHNFVGAISEVAVINRAIDTNQIQRTWEEIKEVISK